MKKVLKKQHNNSPLSQNNKQLFIYVFLFWSLAVAQPLMDLFGNQAVFLIAHEIRAWSLITSTFVLNLVPPLLVTVLVIFLGFISQRLKEGVTWLILWIILSLYFLPFFTSLSSITSFSLSIIVSFLFLYFLVKFQIARLFAAWFALVGVALIFQFLFFSEAKQLLQQKSTNLFKSGIASKTPVFVFVLDELPLLSLLNASQDIDESRFPNISKFVKTATWYRNTSAISSATDIAVPAILSGINPEGHFKVGSYEQYPNNMFSFFSATHSVNAIENTTRMCPPTICKPIIKDPYRLLIEDSLISYLYIILPQDSRKALPPINDRWLGFLRDIKNQNSLNFTFSERKKKFINFISSFEDYPDNTLHFIHILLPHAPWRILPDLRLYGFYENDGTPGELSNDDPDSHILHQWSNDQWATRLSWRKHLLQVGAVDTLLGKALEKIKKLKQFDDSIIIITSDHGSSFIPGQSRRMAHKDTIVDISSIPLFIKYPNQSEQVIDKKLASNLDVLPTLLGVDFQANTGIKFDGIDLKSSQIRTAPVNIIQSGNRTTSLPENHHLMFKKHLKEKSSLFPPPAWDSVYNPDDEKPFLNLSIRALNIKNTVFDAISMKNSNLFKHNILNSQYVPSYYRLKINKEIDGVNEILVALNGKIVSHCFTFVHAPNECAGLINPSVFQSFADKSELNFRFFSVISKINAYVVTELKSKGNETAKIVKADDYESIVYDNGVSHKIDRNSDIFGSVSLRITNNDSTYEFYGWSADTIKGIPAKSILFFIDGELFTKTTATLLKPYLEDFYGFQSIVKSGYEITIPKEQLANISQHQFRVFAEGMDGSISEHNYSVSKIKNIFNLTTNRKIIKNDRALLLKNSQKIKSPSNKVIVFDSFDQDYRELSSGDFFKVKKHTQWLGKSVSVVLPVDNSYEKSYKLKITARPLMKSGILEKQRLHVFVDDKKIHESVFMNKSTIELNLTIPANQENSSILTLKMPDADQPYKLLENNTDRRYLSLFVYEFTITQMPM